MPSGTIQVTTPGGTAASATPLRLLAVTAATDGPYPYGAAGENVTITGTGFAGATAAFILGSVTYPVTYTVVSETQITAVVPDLSGSTAPGGAGGFVVTNTPGLSGANFEVRSPVVSSLSPNSGAPGTSVTVTGFNFQRGGGAAAITGLTFNGIAATNFQLINDNQATATVPTGATTGYVRTTGGFYPETYSRGVLFTVALADLVVSTGTPTSPTPIPAGSYNSITVTGTGNGVLAGNVSVASFLTVQTGGSLNDGCFVVSGAGDFTLASGGTLGICSPAGITAAPTTTGAIQNTGTRSFSSDANYVYNGAAAQVTGTGLPAQVRNLTSTNNNAVTLSQAVSVVQALTLNAGNLNLSSRTLTLLSSASGTALVANLGAGFVSGTTVAVQRYIDPSLNAGLAYRHLAAPVANATVASFGSGGTTPVVNNVYNGAIDPSSVTPFPTIYRYDQSRLATSPATTLSAFDKGWVSPNALGDAAGLTTGFTVQLPGASTLSFTGQVGNGVGGIPLSRASGPTAAEAGLNLVGNPYPSPLDFSTITAAQRNNMDAAFYVFESTSQYGGNYRTYINGAGASSLVGTAQAFFVRVSAGQTSGTLNLDNSNRVTTYAQQAPVRRTAETRPLVQLDLQGATGSADAFIAYAQNGATAGFDGEYDAPKLPNSSGLNLSSTAASGERLAIEGRPEFLGSTVLPLSVGVPAAGTYTLAATRLLNLPTGLDAYLFDAQTGQTVNLRNQPSYSFTVTASQATALLVGRFSLRFTASALATAPALTAAQVALYPNPAHARFSVLMPGVGGAATVQAELVNSLGQVVRRQAAALPASGVTLSVETADLAAGVYTLRLQAGATTLAKRVVLQ